MLSSSTKRVFASKAVAGQLKPSISTPLNRISKRQINFLQKYNNNNTNGYQIGTPNRSFYSSTVSKKRILTSAFRRSTPLRREEFPPDYNPHQQQQPHYYQQPLNNRNIQPPAQDISQIIPPSPYNPYAKQTNASGSSIGSILGNTTTTTTTGTTTTFGNDIPIGATTKKSSYIKNGMKLVFASLFRVGLAAGVVGGIGFGAIVLFPQYTARAIAWWKELEETHYYLLPEHRDEYYYPLQDDGYVPIPKLYKSYQTDIVKKLFHLFYELNYLESNYEDINARLSENYRELLKIRSYKIDDLDLWLLPQHLTKVQEQVKNELTVDTRFRAQIDLDVLHYLRKQLFFMYWDTIHVNLEKDVDPDDKRLQRKFLRDLLDLKHEVDNLLDILDLTSLIAYQTKRFTYQWVPTTDEEKLEFKALYNMKQQHPKEFSDFTITRSKFLGDQYIDNLPNDPNAGKTILPRITFPTPSNIFNGQTDESGVQQRDAQAALENIHQKLNFMSSRNIVRDGVTNEVKIDDEYYTYNNSEILHDEDELKKKKKKKKKKKQQQQQHDQFETDSEQQYDNQQQYNNNNNNDDDYTTQQQQYVESNYENYQPSSFAKDYNDYTESKGPKKGKRSRKVLELDPAVDPLKENNTSQDLRFDNSLIDQRGDRGGDTRRQQTKNQVEDLGSRFRF